MPGWRLYPPLYLSALSHNLNICFNNNSTLPRIPARGTLSWCYVLFLGSGGISMLAHYHANDSTRHRRRAAERREYRPYAQHIQRSAHKDKPAPHSGSCCYGVTRVRACEQKLREQRVACDGRTPLPTETRDGRGALYSSPVPRHSPSRARLGRCGGIFAAHADYSCLFRAGSTTLNGAFTYRGRANDALTRGDHFNARTLRATSFHATCSLQFLLSALCRVVVSSSTCAALATTHVP